MATVLQHHPRGAHFGEFLRDARERRGLTVRDVSNETKIPRRHLEAFEHGDLTVVPHRMYRRAEVRAYAQAVGLDQNVALAELENALLVLRDARSRNGCVAHAGLDRPSSSDRRRRLPRSRSQELLLIAWQQWTKPTARGPAARPAPAASPVPDAAYAGPSFSSANTEPTTTAAIPTPQSPVSPPAPALQHRRSRSWRPHPPPPLTPPTRSSSPAILQARG